MANSNQIRFEQHTYTSVRRLGEYGTYQRSTGLQTDFVKKLEQLGNYAPPPHLSLNPDVEKGGLAEYPIAFTHVIWENEQHVFCKSTYVGEDRHSRVGRMGNFFSHSLVQKGNAIFPLWLLLEEGVIAWQDKIEGNRKSAEQAEFTEDCYLSLPFNISELLEKALKEASSFLKKDRNRDKLAQLIDALIDQAKNKTRIIIKDEPEALLSWIKLLMLVFPDHLVRTLSFSSYQHNPNVNYDVIGIADKQYSEKELPAPDFCMLTGTNEPKHAYTTFLVDVVLLQGELADYQAFMYQFSNAEKISPKLNDIIETERVLHKYHLATFDLTDMETDIRKWSALQDKIEALAARKNPVIFYNWAWQQLIKSDFELTVLKTYWKWIAVEKQSECLRSFCNKRPSVIRNAAFIDFLKLHFENIMDPQKIDLLDDLLSMFTEPLSNQDLFYKFLLNYTGLLVSNQKIKKIQEKFVTDYYKDFFQKSYQKQEEYKLVKALNENHFKTLEAKNTAYGHIKAIKNAFEQLHKWNLEPLVELLEAYPKEAPFLKLLNQFFSNNSIQESLNPAKLSLENIIALRAPIETISKNESIKKQIPRLLNAVLLVLDDNFDKLNQLRLDKSELEKLVEKFQKANATEAVEKIMIFQLNTEYANTRDETKHYELLDRFLKAHNKFITDKLAIIKAYLEQKSHKPIFYNYHFFRYVQMLYVHQITYPTNHQSMIEGHLSELKQYLNEILTKSNEVSLKEPSLAAEIKRTIQQICTKEGLIVKNYITSNEYQSNEVLFGGETDLKLAVQNAEKLRLAQILSGQYKHSGDYDRFLVSLFNHDLFKKNWTYADWKYFIGTLEFDVKEKHGKFNFDITIPKTIDFLMERMNEPKLEESKLEQTEKLLVEYVLSILHYFIQQSAIDALMLHLRSPQNRLEDAKRKRSLLKVFTDRALSHMAYIVGNEKREFKDFENWLKEYRDSFKIFSNLL